MKTPIRGGLTGRLSLACALSVPLILASAHAQTEADPVLLDHVVVSATRTATDPLATPSVVTLLNTTDLANAQTPDLAAAIATVPGVNVARTGAVGGPTYVYMRGASNDHTLWMVDGIRMNTGDATVANFVGGADYAGIGRIEVLSGPQSTLYGSSALGGVILVDTASGCGPVSGSVTTQAGSFGTYGSSAAVKGGSKSIGYSASLSSFSTQNERDFNDYESVSYSARLESQLTPVLLVGVTVRGQDATSDAPGSVGSTFVGIVDSTNTLATVYAAWTPVESFHSRLTYGWVQQEYTYTAEAPPRGNAFDSDYYSRDTRNVFDWVNDWAVTDWLSLVGGGTLDYEKVHSFSDPTVNDFNNDSQAAYLLANVTPVEHLTVLGGVRYDHYDESGDATTWKTGVSYYIVPSRTKLRVNYGTGFNAPRPVYVVGGPFYNANPSLQPEESKGWDAGFDQEIWKDRATLGVTYFHNDFTNLFVYDFTIPGIVNTGSATSEGVEFSLNLTPVEGVKTRLAYTWLEATNDTVGVPLTRRPRHVFDAETSWQATQAWLVGAGVHFAARRYDGSTTAPVRVEDYTTVRLFNQYQVTKAVLVKARVENLLDEKYSEISGYPSLPLAVYGSVEWRF
ncbi:MAG: TonB-dependent receptor [Opitutaceae bacterium]|jgi:vitamin B12 transporter